MATADLAKLATDASQFYGKQDSGSDGREMEWKRSEGWTLNAGRRKPKSRKEKGGGWEMR